ncbi:MAG: hypothetical protein ACOYJZ_07375 [Acutalibacter sp.]
MFKHEDLINALVQAKRLGNALDEVWSCSQQLAEAVDRNDQVSVRLVLSMREEPLTKVRQADTALRSQRNSFPEREDREKFSRLLNGEEEGSGEEALLSKQMAQNRRSYQRVMDLERRLNQKIARDKSVLK